MNTDTKPKSIAVQRCVSCCMINPRGTRTCPFCDYTPPRKPRKGKELTK